MNKTEARYAQYLDTMVRLGQVRSHLYEGIKLRLADKKTFYTPDFFVVRPDMTIECHEVKGFWRDDARIKIKVAATLFPFRFVAVKAQTKRDGDGWEFEQI